MNPWTVNTNICRTLSATEKLFSSLSTHLSLVAVTLNTTSYLMIKVFNIVRRCKVGKLCVNTSIDLNFHYTKRQTTRPSLISCFKFLLLSFHYSWSECHGQLATTETLNKALFSGTCAPYLQDDFPCALTANITLPYWVYSLIIYCLRKSGSSLSFNLSQKTLHARSTKENMSCIT